MSNLLALDQSSRITGWSVFENAKLFDYGKFEFTDNDMSQRLLNIKTKVKELIQQYDINEVIFEDIQMQDNVANNVQTFKVLAQVQGMLLTLFAEMGIPYSIVLASQWKSTLGIKGRTRAEQKRNAQQYIIYKYGVKPTQDEADSICIGEHSIYQNQNDWS